MGRWGGSWLHLAHFCRMRKLVIDLDGHVHVLASPFVALLVFLDAGVKLDSIARRNFQCLKLFREVKPKMVADRVASKRADVLQQHRWLIASPAAFGSAPLKGAKKGGTFAVQRLECFPHTGIDTMLVVRMRISIAQGKHMSNKVLFCFPAFDSSYSRTIDGIGRNVE